MGAGVEIVEVAGELLHAQQVFLQHIQTVFTGLILGGAEIHCVAAVGHQGGRSVPCPPAPAGPRHLRAGALSTFRPADFW